MKRFITLSILTSSFVLLTACSKYLGFQNNQPEPQTTPEAIMEEVMEKEESVMMGNALEVEEGQTLYAVNIEDSIVSWEAQKRVGATHTGTVNLAAGSIVLEEDEFVTANFVMDMQSINDEDLSGAMKEQLEGHLKSEDFFAVEQYPTAELIVTGVEPISEGEYELTATLTIKGISNEISFPATVTKNTTDQIEATASFAIDRSKWDVRFGSESFFDNLGDNLIEDEIDFTVSILAETES